LPLVFKGPQGNGSIKLSEAEKVELTIGSGIPETELKKPYDMEVECIWFKKGEKGS
jgi:hypothetical protein